jgi:hypothetical protein
VRTVRTQNYPPNLAREDQRLMLEGLAVRSKIPARARTVGGITVGFPTPSGPMTPMPPMPPAIAEQGAL